MKKSDLYLICKEQKIKIKELENLLKPHSRSKFLKYVKDRDNNRCRLCLSEIDLQVHHLTPVSLGGSNDYNNLVTLCSKCHHYLHYCNPMVKFGVIGQSHKELTKIGMMKAKKEGKNIGRLRNINKVTNTPQETKVVFD